MTEPTDEQSEAVRQTYIKFLTPHKSNEKELWNQQAWDSDVALFLASVKEQGLAKFAPDEEDLGHAAAHYKKGVPEFEKPGWLSPALKQTFDLKCLDGLVAFGPKGEDHASIKHSDSLNDVVLVFFWNEWCGPCHQDMPYLKFVRERYPASRLSLFVVERAMPDASLEESVRGYVENCRSEGRMPDSDVYYDPTKRTADDIWRRVGLLAVPVVYLFKDRVLEWYGHARKDELGPELEKYLPQWTMTCAAATSP